ncbi:MAG: bifunctional heptose 7-phosphate kinase/heptose 1-phosphate adenyltransferase [Verrucomicrobiales bacterium]
MDIDRLKTYLGAFRNKRLLVVGDVMLDCFIWGNVTRISPEAPVPVVEVQSQTNYPGGAANVARNLLPFCGQVSVAGLTGIDPLASELAALLKDSGIETAGLLQDANYQTIVKTRIIARGQQVVRIDHEKRMPLDDRLLGQVLEFLDSRMSAVDAIIIEDYGKGFVTQGLVDGIANAARGAGVLVTADPNPTNSLDWNGITAVKPNRSEAFQAAGMNEASLRLPGSLAATLDQLGKRLFAKWDIKMLLITLSEQGMALLERDCPPYLLPTRARGVFDVSGAGDTAIALFTLALCAGAAAREAAEISNHAAGVVVGKVGTATLSPEELIDAFAKTEE